MTPQPSPCGCKIESKWEMLSGQVNDWRIVYCPRHSPERVERLEDALRAIVALESSQLTKVKMDALMVFKQFQAESTTSWRMFRIAQEALKLPESTL